MCQVNEIVKMYANTDSERKKQEYNSYKEKQCEVKKKCDINKRCIRKLWLKFFILNGIFIMIRNVTNSL